MARIVGGIASSHIPAIGNAIANALGGARVRDLPVKPHKIIAALSRKEVR